MTEAETQTRRWDALEERGWRLEPVRRFGHVGVEMQRGPHLAEFYIRADASEDAMARLLRFCEVFERATVDDVQE